MSVKKMMVKDGDIYLKVAVAMSGALTANRNVTAVDMDLVTLTVDIVSALQGGLERNVRHLVPKGHMVQTVVCCVTVKMEPNVTSLMEHVIVHQCSEVHSKSVRLHRDFVETLV